MQFGKILVSFGYCLKFINKAGNLPPLNFLGSRHLSPLGSFTAGAADMEQLTDLSLGIYMYITCFTYYIIYIHKIIFSLNFRV